VPDVSPETAGGLFVGAISAGLGLAVKLLVSWNAKRLAKIYKDTPPSSSMPPAGARLPRPALTPLDYSGQMAQRIAQLEAQRDELGAKLVAAELERHKATWLAEERFEETAEAQDALRKLTREVESLRALLGAARDENMELRGQIEATNSSQRGTHGRDPDARSATAASHVDRVDRRERADPRLPSRRQIPARKPGTEDR
jgi:hypothetical protein